MKPLYTFLEQKEKTILCIVAATFGSCPGRVGFKMLVYKSKATRGSIGGGNMEFKVILKAKMMLESNTTLPQLVSYEHTSQAEPEEQSGMICSGRQKIILIPSASIPSSLKKVQLLRVNRQGLFFPDKKQDDFKAGLTDSTDQTWEYLEEIKPEPMVYIFGGGHCSLALTPILNTLGMQVTVIDDRENIWTMQENHFAKKKIVSRYSEVTTLVKDNSLVIIMTASHQGDATVLKQMLPKELKYIGMLGSKTTANYILNEMKTLGFSDEQISKVNTPIGLPISSQTPAEIAISIAAEIIQKGLN